MPAQDLRRSRCLLRNERIALAVAALAFSTFVSGADQKPPQENTAKSTPTTTTKVAAEKRPTANEAAIRATAVAFVKAFNKGDAKAIASMWMSDGTVADDEGRLIKGAKPLRTNTPRSSRRSPTRGWRSAFNRSSFPRPRWQSRTGSLKCSREQRPAVGRSLHRRARPRGRKVAHRDGPRDMLAVPSNYHRLQELGWAVGSWESKSENIRRRFRLRWIANKNFLDRDFTVEQDGLLSTSGTQVIGWDPRSQQIVSWTFDSTGGYSTARWSPLPDGWRIESEGVSADGLPTSSKDRVVHVPGDDNVSATAPSIAASETGDCPTIARLLSTGSRKSGNARPHESPDSRRKERAARFDILDICGCDRLQ